MSCCGFQPPRDENGRVLSHEEWRERMGDPIGEEEHRLINEINAMSDTIYARTKRPDATDLLPLWRLQRQLRALNEPRQRMHWRRRREERGFPVTSEEETLRDEVFYLEMTHAFPWPHAELVRSNELHEKLRNIENSKGVRR
jgi:hypothetical protein